MASRGTRVSGGTRSQKSQGINFEEMDLDELEPMIEQYENQLTALQRPVKGSKKPAALLTRAQKDEIKAKEQDVKKCKEFI